MFPPESTSNDGAGRGCEAASDTGFRRPVAPWPVESFEIPHPSLPRELDGLTILHLTDLHARHHPHANLPGTFAAVLHALRTVPSDLVVFTGDAMHDPGHEQGAIETLRQIGEAIAANPPRLGLGGVGGIGGALGIIGNHDTWPLLKRLGRDGEGRDVEPGNSGLGGFVWLANPAQAGSPRHASFMDGRLVVLGMSWPEDPLGAMLEAGLARPRVEADGSMRPFVLTLAHIPTVIVAAAEIGLPLVLAGHTHAGQVRLHAKCAPYTSSDLPADLATGVLRLGSTLCCVSRGLGDAVLEGLRFNCPHQLARYVLRRGALPGLPQGADSRYVQQVVGW